MKKLSSISLVVSAMVLAGLCGCSSDSDKSQSSTPPAQTASQPPPKPKDKRPIEQRLVVGMTMDQVKAACGNPKNEAMNSDGSATWMYNNSEKAFIPYYSITGGKIHNVTVFFDTTGKVTKWSTSDTGAY
jgi:outer membrane protein assembly factor BamE (lipoprotein component of BamABCDE complex)